MIPMTHDGLRDYREPVCGFKQRTGWFTRLFDLIQTWRQER